jgi:hypothetical protein
VEGATLRRLRRGWISTITSVCALAISLALMSMADVGGNFTRPEHVLNLGGGPRGDHSGFGNSMFPPVQETRPGAPAGQEPTTPTSVADGGSQASLISASGDNVASGGVEPIVTTTTSIPTTVAAGGPGSSTTTTTTTAPVHVVDDQYTDGTQCSGSFCPGGPPPTNPVFLRGSRCKTDVVDPPTLTFVTEHFVYGTTPPPAGAVPVTDDASAVYPYVRFAPGLMKINVEAFVAGKQGFRAATWNIGQGVTAWVPFDCRGHKATPTTTTTTTTTTTVRKANGRTTGNDVDLCPRDAATSERAATDGQPRRGRTARPSSR